MEKESGRDRAVRETRERILEVARDLLGERPDAGMGEVASAAGVVRRTVYGHFPTRMELVETLTERAVDEIVRALSEIDRGPARADAAWAEFVTRLWPVTRRYRVLLALRRGEFGERIHELLGPVDTVLADLVRGGQESGRFGSHLPAEALSQLAYATVFTIADGARSGSTPGDRALDVRAATIASLLLLGVPESRAIDLADGT